MKCPIFYNLYFNPILSFLPINRQAKTSCWLVLWCDCKCQMSRNLFCKMLMMSRLLFQIYSILPSAPSARVLAVTALMTRGHELTRWTEKSVMTGWQEEDDWPTLREGENTIIMKLNISSISNHKNTVIWTYLSVIPMYDGPPPKIHVIILQTNKLDSI